MKVTIITATYNNQVTIKDTIESVANQTYKNIEHIIVDGLSKDDTVNVIKSYNLPHIKIISEKDKGIYDALNKGLRAATGEVIGFVHADDFLAAPNVIETLVANFKGDINCVYGNKIYVSQTDKNKIVRYWKSNQYQPSDLSKGWMPPHLGTYFAKSVYDQYGHFDINFRISADYDFLLRVFSKNTLKVKYIDFDVVKMRMGGASTSISQFKKKWQEDYEAITRNKVGGIFTLLNKSFSKISQLFLK